MVDFIEENKNLYGVGPTCDVRPIVPSTYDAQSAQRMDPTKRCERAKRDEALVPEVERVWKQSQDGVYEAEKVWRQLRRESHTVAHAQLSG